MYPNLFLPLLLITLACVFAIHPARAQPPTAPSAATEAGAPLSREDAGMLEDLAQANLAEIEMGRIALERSRSEAVRGFAQKMVGDHGAAMREVRQFAQSRNLRLPDGPGAKQLATAAAMRALRGDTFDRSYLSQSGVDDHHSTLRLLQKMQKEAQDIDLRKLARGMAPVVAAHLAEAERLTMPPKK